MPHINTLKKYLNYTAPKSGFNRDVIQKLVIDSKLDILEGHQKEVSLSFDEMKIQQGLVYQRSTGKLVGFCEMGDINQEITNFQSRCKDIENDEQLISTKLAKYVNVFMVRGIFSNLESTIGYHASSGFTGDQLFPLVWEATRVLEAIGFKVRSWVCDGASPNRTFFKINGILNKIGISYYVINRFAPERKIYFISDVPHLIKTTRNNLENSHGHMNTKNLHVSITFIYQFSLLFLFKITLLSKKLKD